MSIINTDKYLFAIANMQARACTQGVTFLAIGQAETLGIIEETKLGIQDFGHSDIAPCCYCAKKSLCHCQGPHEIISEVSLFFFLGIRPHEEVGQADSILSESASLQPSSFSAIFGFLTLFKPCPLFEGVHNLYSSRSSRISPPSHLHQVSL